MDWSQVLYAGLLALALIAGRPPLIIAAALVFDFAATMTLAADPVSVAIVDLIAILMLIGRGARANIIAGLFVIMQPLYIAAHNQWLSHAAAYSIVDLIAYVQLGVAGGMDRGILTYTRNLLRLFTGSSDFASLRVRSSDHAVNQKMRRE